MLTIVPTPIGNLADMTFRSVELLKSVDAILAEDTRHSHILMKHYDIQTPLNSFHSYTNEKKLNDIIFDLKKGKNFALISDAGTPTISDPGYILVKKCVEEGIEVSSLPGATACITALSASGLPADKFMYLGFLPIKKGRQTILTEIQESKRTVIFYESVHRIQKTLTQLAELMPDRNIVVARELTKLHEEYFRGTTQEAEQYFSSKNPKGEFVIILGGKSLTKLSEKLKLN